MKVKKGKGENDDNDKRDDNKPEVADFEMPDELLRQIEECSRGGFILFAIDVNGHPAVYDGFDGQAFECLLHAFAQDWLKASSRLRLKGMELDILDAKTGFLSDEEEEEEEGE